MKLKNWTQYINEALQIEDEPIVVDGVEKQKVEDEIKKDGTPKLELIPGKDYLLTDEDDIEKVASYKGETDDNFIFSGKDDTEEIVFNKDEIEDLILNNKLNILNPAQPETEEE